MFATVLRQGRLEPPLKKSPDISRPRQRRERYSRRNESAPFARGSNLTISWRDGLVGKLVRFLFGNMIISFAQCCERYVRVCLR